MAPRTDLIGRTYGKLTVTGLAGKRKDTYQWHCVCECGNRTTVDVSSLNAGRTRSCGCSMGAKTTHGKFGTKVYSAWVAMIQRCENPNSRNYHNYGGRGIEVCERWRTFENFLEDIREPQPGESIDRIDNNKGYSPINCRWASTKRQRRNTRNTFKVTYRSKEVAFADLWEKRAHENVYYSLASHRIKKLGWSVEKALRTPPRCKD